jgi:nucleoside-diphosphate-sugar epimerase
MKVLITGGGGFVGSHLSEAFLARGDDVSILDTGSVVKVRHLMGKPGFHYIRDSVFNTEILEGLPTSTSTERKTC